MLFMFLKDFTKIEEKVKYVTGSKMKAWVACTAVAVTMLCMLDF